MADYVELYFGAPQDTDDSTAIAYLGDLLGVRFEPSTAYYADYEAHDGRRHYDLNLGIEEDEDDPDVDMPFTKMPYVLTLRGDRDMDAEMESIGRKLIPQLRQRGYLPARLIYGTLLLLDKAD
ncbi:hypothetical protein [Allokutzneria albata]|uniref:Uncharacterized protein n=1 Tax=Allokutzneria albata TaxID=211114 RepID=A0A1G9V3C0_ALLAB|nr:hypothetical protein [Allokutzneria albata]SDM66638.1 hypothetical protein SAMN04489726_2804 [Allokutzneria albata]